MSHAADLLQESIDGTGSIACVGLDPRPQLVPPAIRAEALRRHGDTRLAVAWAFTEFNRGILAAVAGRCACIKPQIACYEAYGSAGLAALEETLVEAQRLGLQVIADGKRNDIGSTAEHYAQGWQGSAPSLGGGHLPGVGAQWLTVNGYLGHDGIAPFIGRRPSGTGVFVLVRTSNPSAADVQDLTTSDGSIMQTLARLVTEWGQGRQGACGLTDVGAVVGATWPQQAQHLRELMPDTLFLIPGYGAQGGSAADALAGRRRDGRGVVINSSRGIIGAWQGRDGDWREAVAAALEAMNADLNRHR